MSTGMMIALAIAGVSVIGIWMLSRRVPHVVDDDWAPPDDEDVALADPLDEEMRDVGVMGRIRANELLAEQRQPSPPSWAPEPPAPERTAVAGATGETAGAAPYGIDGAAGAPPGIVFLATPTGQPVPEPAAQPIAQPIVQPIAQPIVQHQPTPQPAVQWEPQLATPEFGVVPQPIPEPEPELVLRPPSAQTQTPPAAPVLQPPASAASSRVPSGTPLPLEPPAPEPQVASGYNATPGRAAARDPVSTPAPVPVASVSAPPTFSQPVPAAATPPPAQLLPTPVPPAAAPPAAAPPAAAVRPAPVVKPAAAVQRFAGVIRGDSSRHGDGRERRYVTLKKKEAVGFPWREGGRVPVDLEVNGKVYSAGVRATRSQPVVYIAADLRGPTGESVTLAAVLEAAGMEKRQQVTIDVENGTYLRLLPGAVPMAAAGGKGRK